MSWKMPENQKLIGGIRNDKTWFVLFCRFQWNSFLHCVLMSYVTNQSYCQMWKFIQLNKNYNHKTLIPVSTVCRSSWWTVECAFSILVMQDNVCSEIAFPNPNLKFIKNVLCGLETIYWIQIHLITTIKT